MIVLKKADRKINQAVLMPVIDVEYFDFGQLEETIQANIILLDDAYDERTLNKIKESNTNVFVVCELGQTIKVQVENFVYIFNNDFLSITKKVETLSGYLSPENIRNRYEIMLDQFTLKLTNMEEQINFLQKGMEELSRTNSELILALWNNENN